MADDPKTPPKTLDAVLVKPYYPPGLHDRAKSLALNAEFGALLGAERLQCTILPGNEVLLTRIPPTTQTAGEHRYHASNHPLAGQERYDWSDRGDGILFGLLKPDATAADVAAAEAERLKTTAERVKAKATKDAARLKELKAVPADALTPDQRTETARLERFAAVLGTSEAPAHEPAPEPEAEAEKNAP